jgi:hypothetical protein
MVSTLQHQRHHSKRAFHRNEAISFSAGPDNGNLIIEIFDHKTFGKDKLLAHGTLAVSVSFATLELKLTDNRSGSMCRL